MESLPAATCLVENPMKAVTRVQADEKQWKKFEYHKKRQQNGSIKTMIFIIVVYHCRVLMRKTDFKYGCTGERTLTKERMQKVANASTKEFLTSKRGCRGTKIYQMANSDTKYCIITMSLLVTCVESIWQMVIYPAINPEVADTLIMMTMK